MSKIPFSFFSSVFLYFFFFFSSPLLSFTVPYPRRSYFLAYKQWPLKPRSACLSTHNIMKLRASAPRRSRGCAARCPRPRSDGCSRVSMPGSRARQLLRARWPWLRLPRRQHPTASFSASVTATVFPACVAALTSGANSPTVHRSEQGAGRRASGSATKRCRGELLCLCVCAWIVFYFCISQEGEN